jgi:GST-like protein
MYTLFGADRSGSAAIEIALQYCGAHYTVVSASTGGDEGHKAQLDRVNPLGQVPVLECPDGTVLSESAAILIALGLEFPAAGLLSLDPRERALQLRALVFITANCYAAIGVIDYPERWLPTDEKAPADALIQGATRRLHGYWDTFSDVFAATPAWRPDTPGAVEILACVVSQWSGARDHLRTTQPAFHAALLALDQHPRLQPVRQRHWPDA